MNQISTQAQSDIAALQERAERAWASADSMSNFVAGDRLRAQAQEAEQQYVAACRTNLCCEAPGCFNETQFGDYCTYHGRDRNKING